MYDKRTGLKLIRFLLCGLLVVLIGCAAKTGGSVDVGAIVNANKQHEETLAVSAPAAYKATVEALRELNMSITGEYSDGTSAEMKSKSADNEIAWVKITPINAVSCKVTVSVDVFANESSSRSILTSILKHLPNGSAASEVHRTTDNLKKPENIATGTGQQPVESEDAGSTVDTQPEKLKPLPEEVVTEKSLL